MIPLKQIEEYYGRADIAAAMLEFAKDREVVGRTLQGNYGNRPNAVAYASDFLQMLRENYVSFHGSVERWKNPMALSSELKVSELAELRTGWDFLIDIDCDFFEHSRIAADLFVQALKAHGIKSVSVKFSGGSGFHIAVPFEAFPSVVDGRRIVDYFPEAPRVMANHLKDFVKERLAEELVAFEGSPTKLARRIGKSPIKDGKIDPYTALELDTILISPRHLIRMPYSLHERTWLASVVIEPKNVLKFELEDARTDKVKKVLPFCGRAAAKNEAYELVSAAFTSLKPTEVKKIKIVQEFKGRVPEEAFPQCMKLLLSKRLEDGRKRGEFIIRTFLRKVGWSWDDIEERLSKWNEGHPQPLRTNYIKQHIEWQKRQRKEIMPPNCNSALFYDELGIKTPECEKHKNPVVGALRNLKRAGHKT